MEREYRERCAARGLDAEKTEAALAVLRELSDHSGWNPETRPGLDVKVVESFVAKQTGLGTVSAAWLVGLARYFAVVGDDSIAIRLLAYALPVGVLPAMAERLEQVEGKTVAAQVLEGLVFPAEGASPESYPSSTSRFVRALLAELGPERTRRVLTWNVHGIPAAAFVGEAKRLAELGSVDAWLADYHQRQVAVLQKHADDGTLWFEQKITQAVVDWVAARQEILSGRREGRTIYATKIPYDPARYIESTDALERRRLACHCPLAVSGIQPGTSEVPDAWCACSAGYEKFMFECAFGTEVDARVLHSVLGGEDSCRFAMTIPASVPDEWLRG